MGNTHSSKSGNKSSSNMLSSKNLKVGSSFKAPDSILLRDKGCYTLTRKTKFLTTNNKIPRYTLNYKTSNGKRRSFTAWNADNKMFKKCRARTLKKKAK